MIYAAANYGGHIREMLNAGTARTEEERENMLDRDKARVRPYSFLKAPSSLAGAFDDIVIPPETQKVDWEVELALVIGRTAKRVPAERALDYVAGYMTTQPGAVAPRALERQERTARRLVGDLVRQMRAGMDQGAAPVGLLQGREHVRHRGEDREPGLVRLIRLKRLTLQYPPWRG